MEHIWSAVQPYGVVAAGAMCGAGWWVFLDALVYSGHTAAPFAWWYCTPLALAMLGVLLLGSVGREEDGGYYGDEGEACRGKCVLFLAYVIAFGSIGLGTTLLLVDKQRGADLWPAASATLSATVLSASGLLLWLSRNSEDSGYSIMG
ncbi:MAG: hypothetical protein J3K34DRAFT_457288 [Monoraphidium minutum]|nr:MAG: hypothetical protein J3K34DRAFT_457288 [Monoraphidium minutum]